MVVIVVLLTFAAFVAADLLLGRRQAAEEAATASAPARGGAAWSPDLLLFHAGHGWARVSPDGERAAVGADEFAPRFAGRLAAVELPREGVHMRQGETAVVLVSERGRRLAIEMPLEGDVLEVNTALLREPERMQRSPYEAGWALQIRPRRLARSLPNLLPNGLARAWLDAVKSRLTTRLSPLGVLATDGGEWADAFGDRLDDASWEDLRRELFPRTDIREKSR